MTAGHARFTVVTPNLVRLEYAPAGRFVDDPSWFATQRNARFDDAKVARDGNTVIVDTGPVRLTYTDDGKPFSSENLSAAVRRGEQTVTWHPGDKPTGNLGGTLRTLDGVRNAVPLDDGVVSRDGWSVIDDSASVLLTADWMKPRPDPANTDWYLFGYGTDYRAALKSLTAVSGPVPMPRKYTLGLWYSRYWSFTADAFKQIVDEYDRHGFPLDTMVLDMGWHLDAAPKGTPGRINTWTGYTWNKSLIPDPAGLLKWMHQRGLHVTLNDHPAAGVQPHEAMYGDFMHAMGQDPAGAQTLSFDAGDKHYLDTFYQATHVPHEQEGVDFWWLDWQQFPKTLSLPELTNLQVLNRYYYTRAEHDDLRGQSFSRWGGWGDHRYPIQFSGDADTNWPMLAFEVPFTSAGGNSGAFFWTHDIGGHMGGRNEESYARWCQFGALSATLRSHSSKDPTTDRRPWNYPKWAEDSMRVSFRLRSVLMPYIYTAVHAATADSVPFLRPLYYDYPTDEAAYHNGQEYLFGDDLLVAPITTPGIGPGRVAAQAVWFPPGDSDWYDWFTGESFAGGEHAVATAPIDQFPLYVRGGVPLPTQPYTPRPATAALTTLVVRCYPGRDGAVGTSTVYEDDGTTVGYAHGQSATTPLTYVRHGDDVTVTVGPTAGTYPGLPQRRGVIVELPNTQPGAKADGGVITATDIPGITHVTLPPAPVGEKRTVTIHVTSTPPQQMQSMAVGMHVDEVLGFPVAARPARPDAATARMTLAAQGRAVLPVSQHPYGLGQVAQVFLSNHQTLPKNLTLNGPTTRPVTVSSGDVIAQAPDAGPHPLRTIDHATLGGFADGSTLPVDLPGTLSPAADLATRAVATASTGDAAAAIDGSTDGYPGDQRREWVTTGEKADAWLKLTWDRPVRMGRVLLYDRPNAADHVLAGRLTFSDGPAIDVGPLPNDGQSPGVYTFPARTCQWVKFTVTQAGAKTENIGLSEIAVTADTK